MRALVLSDLVDSTALVERLGDQATVDLIRRHDRMAREILQRHGGREIDKTDGFLIFFERPIQAVLFAVDYQRKLQAFAKEVGQPFNARVGIHFGEVVVWENPPADVAKGAKPVEVEGLAKPVAARLMALALPGQILVSAVAHSLAQRAQLESGDRLGDIRWCSHGSYLVKGVPEPIAVFEVGEPGIAPLCAPPASAKAGPVKPLWRRPQPMMFAALALVIAGAVVGYVLTRSESALGFGERDWIVVADFNNVNADKSLEGSLNTAFRMGIEESRYVNVVPDLTIRQALDRMQRDPRTRIDREVGSEIAVREQARALLLPSIAQYGQKVRLTAELVDPNGARTVSIQTADADGPGDVLPAIDRLLHGVRTRLGESLKQINTTSQPLEKATTANLAALRALSQAREFERDGDLDQAGRLLRFAIELDPNFALAYVRLGAVLLQLESYIESRAALEKALAFEGRLTDRERFYVRALLAEFDDPQTAVNEWRAFASMYPDYGTGQNNIGNISYSSFHDYATAEAAYTKAAVPRNPLLNDTLASLAYVMLAQEKIDEAEKKFRAAYAISPSPEFFGLSDVLVAGGRLDDAAGFLDSVVKQPAASEVERVMRRATLLVARGQVGDAAALLQAELPSIGKVSSLSARWRAQAALIALQADQNQTAAARTMMAQHIGELSSIAVRGDGHTSIMEELLYAAGWAARLGLVKEARDALAVAGNQGALNRYPVRRRLATVAQAEMELQAGRPEMAIAQLHEAGVNELWELHEVRVRAFRALGDASGEHVELRWLTSHRGLAQAQWTDQLLGQQARTLALVRAAERLAASGPRT